MRDPARVDGADPDAGGVEVVVARSLGPFGRRDGGTGRIVLISRLADVRDLEL